MQAACSSMMRLARAQEACLSRRAVASRTLRRRAATSVRKMQTGPAVPSQIGAATRTLLEELKYLEEGDLRARFDSLDANGDGMLDVDEAHALLQEQCDPARGDAAEKEAQHIITSLGANNDGRVSWEEFKSAADVAATPVDARVRPIYATLILTFVSQGIQFPVLPQLARSIELSTADLGYVSAATSLSRMVCNVPAAMAAERVGRRPLLIAGPAVSAVGMLGLANAASFESLVAANVAIGAGMALAMAGASNYLADISTPRNRAQTTAPLLQSALIGFAVGPAVGGLLAQYSGLSLPFVACAAGLGASSLTGAMLLPETLHEATARARKLAAQRPAAPATSAAPAEASTAEASTAEASFWHLLSRPAMQGLLATVLTNGVGQGAMPITVVLYAVETVDLSSAAVGAMLTANVAVMVVASVPAARLSDKVTDRKAVMLPALLGGTAFFAAQPLAASAWHYAGLFGLSGFCQALAMPNTTPLILDSIEPAHRAQALALRQMVQDGGALLGAGGAGVVASAYGISAAIELVAGLQAASIAFCALRAPWKQAADR